MDVLRALCVLTALVSCGGVAGCGTDAMSCVDDDSGRWSGKIL